MSNAATYAAIILAGFLPTYVWRLAAVLMVTRIRPDSMVLLWVRAVATALVSAIVVRLVLMPPGLLAETSLTARLSAVAFAVACFYAVPVQRAGVAVLAGSALIFLSQIVAM